MRAMDAIYLDFDTYVFRGTEPARRHIYCRDEGQGWWRTINVIAQLPSGQSIVIGRTHWVVLECEAFSRAC